MNDNDSIICIKLLGFRDEDKFDYFLSVHDQIKDDSNYWNILGTIWKLSGSVFRQDEWKALFASKRRSPHKIMKTRERRQWRRLPKTMKVYRACNSEDEQEYAICWSLSRKVAEMHSMDGHRNIYSRTFSKSDVFAFFDRRGEDEVIVIPPSVS